MQAGTHPSDNDNTVRESDLQAYVDGQLDVRRRAAIEAHLAAHPGEAVRLAAYRSQNIGLHALFDPPGGPDDAARIAELPPTLTALAHELDAKLCIRRAAAASLADAAPLPAARHSSRRTVPHLARLAASIALLLAAGIAGWIALQQAAPSTAPRVALTHENQTVPQATIQAQPAAAPAEPAAAAAPLPETIPSGSTETSSPVKAAPATRKPTLERTPDPGNVDPAMERTPLIPVPQPAVDTTAKDT